MDAIEGLDRSGTAQDRILEVSSLAEVVEALPTTSFTCCTCPATAAA